MPLQDAFLLDPYPTNVWIAKRSDGIFGSGTVTDPFNGSTAELFDEVMNSLDEFTLVHLGPGDYDTHGYSDEDPTAGWQPKAGMKIIGAGIDVTTLKLTGAGVNDRRYYAVAHALPSGQVDFFEISDLTIDCNLADPQVNSVSRGGIRIRGSHSRIRRIKVVNWGTRSSAKDCFVLSMVTAQPDAVYPEIVDCGIEDCVVVQPVVTGTLHDAFALHTGTKEDEWTTDAISWGKGPWIRNCFVDFADAYGQPDFSKSFVGISAGWCDGGVIEGNHVHNVRWGGPAQKTTKTGTLICRTNHYRNVVRGPWGNAGTSDYSIQRWLIEANLVELALRTDQYGLNVPIGIELLGYDQPYSYSQVIIRNNKIRYQDGASDPSYTGWGIKIEGAENAILENNVLEVNPPDPIQNTNCGSVKYFNNQTPAGDLIRGFNEATEQKYDELETEAEDALVLALMNKR